MQIQKSKLYLRTVRSPISLRHHLRNGHYWVGEGALIFKKSRKTIMANSSDSSTSSQNPAAERHSPGWLKVAAVAAVSALAGGVAAAWWHRKTLAKLQQSNDGGPNPDFRISEANPPEEL